MSPLLFYIVIIVALLVLSAFFSAAETAYTAVNRLRLRYKAESGDHEAAAIRGIVENPDRLLGVILLGVTVAEMGQPASSLILSPPTPATANWLGSSVQSYSPFSSWSSAS